MKRVVAIIAVVALVAVTALSVSLVLSELGDEPRTSRTSPPAGPEVTAPPTPGLADFYSQQVGWEPCPNNETRDCATIEVPVDYQEPEGETFELNLLRVPARGEPIGSLVVNPGGPGAPGTSYANLGPYGFGEVLLEHYDIVGFDPRGTGKSAPVDCLSDAEVDDYMAADPDPDTPEEVAAFEDLMVDFGEGCKANSGEIAAHVTTIEAARDMDVLRSALGEEHLTYLGASYGTKLGATYAELFPERVGRFVLDGALDLSLDPRTVSLEQAAGFELALRSYLQDCVDRGDCFLGDSVDDGLERISALMDRIDREPLPAGDRDLHVGNAFYGLVAPLYNEGYWFLLSDALKGALGGDGQGLLALSDMYASRQGDTYADNSMEAFYAINCLDDPASVPVEKIPDHFADFEEASPTFGRIFAWDLAGCGGVELTSSEEPLTVRAEGAAPILVLGTTRDPATPMKWAVALADQLESAVLVRRDGDGHTAYNNGNACVDSLVEDYLVDGVVPEDPTNC